MSDDTYMIAFIQSRKRPTQMPDVDGHALVFLELGRLYREFHESGHRSNSVHVNAFISNLELGILAA